MAITLKSHWWLLIITTWLTSSLTAQEQEEEWSLKKCIAYAQANNLSLKSTELDSRAAALIAAYGRYNYLPDLSMSANYGENFGRTINPVTNQFDNTRFSSVGLSAGTNVLLFGWFQKRYAVQHNNLKLQAADFIQEQSRRDMVLTIATAYLRVLMAKEQAENISLQITTSIANKERLKNLLEAGKSNILAYTQAATQLATDSSSYFQAIINKDQAMIDLKAILNLPLSERIRLREPGIPEGLLEKPDPELIYQMAVLHMPSIKNADIQEAIAKKDIAISRTTLYPQLSLYASSGTNYSSSFYELSPDGEQKLMNFGRQFRNNLSQSIGITLSIPIFHNFSTKQNIASARIALARTKLEQEQARLNLKQEIYKACQDYLLSRERYNMAKNAMDNAEMALKAAKVRFENGLVSYFEYAGSKDNFMKLQNEVSAQKYDIYFKILVIEYYQSAETIL